jgi:hypothetical protein
MNFACGVGFAIMRDECVGGLLGFNIFDDTHGLGCTTRELCLGTALRRGLGDICPMETVFSIWMAFGGSQSRVGAALLGMSDTALMELSFRTYGSLAGNPRVLQIQQNIYNDFKPPSHCR